MKKQKILALLLVATLTLSLSITAFAAEEKVTNTGLTTINVQSTLKLPTIDVTIASPAGILVNPYGMEVNLPDALKPSTETVFSTPCLITNASNIKLKIVATPTASVADTSDVQISTVPIDSLEGKAVYMTMAMSNAKSDVIDKYTGVDDTDGKFTNTKSAILTKKTSSDHNSCDIALAACESAGYETYGVYLITGKSKGSGWKENVDVVDVQLVFDIQPDITTTTTP